MLIGRNDLQPYELDWREFALGRTCKNVRNVRPYSRTCSETITYLSNGVNQEKNSVFTQKNHIDLSFKSRSHKTSFLPSFVLFKEN